MIISNDSHFDFNVLNSIGLESSAGKNRTTSSHPLIIHKIGMEQENPGHRPFANFYVDSNLPMLAIAPKCYERPTHANLHSDLLKSFKEKNINPDIYSFPDGGGYISGFKDGKNLIIRIDDPIDNHKNGITQNEVIEKHLARLEKAILIGRAAVEKKGGQVFLQANTADLQFYAKCLGEMHRIVPFSDFSPYASKEFILNNTLNLKGGQYFYAEWGPRLKSADQIERLLDVDISVQKVAEEGVPKLIDDKYRFLAELQGIIDFMHAKNAYNCNQGLFLVVDKESGELDRSHPTQEALYETLKVIIEYLATIKDEEWNEIGIVEARLNIESFSDSIRLQNHINFIRDDLNNPDFSLGLANILREKKEGVELGEDVSTPMKLHSVGRITIANGEMTLVPFPNATDEHIAFANYIIKEAKEEGKVLEYIYLCEPRTPLTPEFRPSEIVKKYGDPEDVSFVICYGRRNQPEERKVIRLHPNGREHWENIIETLGNSDDPEVLREQRRLKRIGPELLAKIDNLLSQAQSDVFNLLAASDNPAIHFQTPKFEGIELQVGGLTRDYQIRPFIPGKRLDREIRTKMTFEEFVNYGRLLGTTDAINFLAQRPNALLYEHLISGKDPISKLPVKMTSIGLSESFSNIFNVKNALQHLEKVAPVFGANLGSWSASIRFGHYGLEATKDQDPRQFTKTIDEFLQNYSQSFVEKYNEIKARPPITQEAVCKKYIARYKLLKSTHYNQIPKDLDISINFALTESLIDLDPKDVVNKIKIAARMDESLYTHAIIGVSDTNSEGKSLHEINESLIRRVQAILTNHCSDDVIFENIQNVFFMGLDYSAFDIPTRQDLLIIGDVTAWIAKVNPESFDNVFELALTYNNENAFAQRLKLEYGPCLLKIDTAITFHRAINNMVRFINEGEGEEDIESLRLQNALSIMTWSQFKLD